MTLLDNLKFSGNIPYRACLTLRLERKEPFFRNELEKKNSYSCSGKYGKYCATGSCIVFECCILSEIN